MITNNLPKLQLTAIHDIMVTLVDCKTIQCSALLSIQHCYQWSTYMAWDGKLSRRTFPILCTGPISRSLQWTQKPWERHWQQENTSFLDILLPWTKYHPNNNNYLVYSRKSNDYILFFETILKATELSWIKEHHKKVSEHVEIYVMKPFQISGQTI